MGGGRIGAGIEWLLGGVLGARLHRPPPMGTRLGHVGRSASAASTRGRSRGRARTRARAPERASTPRGLGDLGSRRRSRCRARSTLRRTLDRRRRCPDPKARASSPSAALHVGLPRRRRLLRLPATGAASWTSSTRTSHLGRTKRRARRRERRRCRAAPAGAQAARRRAGATETGAGGIGVSMSHAGRRDGVGPRRGARAMGVAACGGRGAGAGRRRPRLSRPGRLGIVLLREVEQHELDDRLQRVLHADAGRGHRLVERARCTC